MKRLTLCALIMCAMFFQGCKTLNVKKENKVLEKIDGIVRDKNEKIPSSKKIDCDYYFIYYGADWCPDCKNEEESLKQFYNTYKKKYKNFEVIFVGIYKDKSNEDLTKFMKNGDYPFYYVPFENRDEAGFLQLKEYCDFKVFWIPGFILVDREMNVLSVSNGTDYEVERPMKYYKSLMGEKNEE